MRTDGAYGSRRAERGSPAVSTSSGALRVATANGIVLVHASDSVAIVGE